jgi:predicted negative regulator of RcsB-dependent stress response
MVERQYTPLSMKIWTKQINVPTVINHKFVDETLMSQRGLDASATATAVANATGEGAHATAVANAVAETPAPDAAGAEKTKKEAEEK